jgi:hypothetical protein
MGKSSLCISTIQKLQSQGTACAVVGLKAISCPQITQSEWCLGVIRRLIKGFGLPINGLRWWLERESIPPISRLQSFLEDVLLSSIDSNVVIFFDEIEKLIPLDFKSEFIGLLQTCYELRSYNPIYQRLSFTLFGVAKISDLAEGGNYKLFVQGKAITLGNFEIGYLKPLHTGLTNKTKQPEVLLSHIFTWTNGHPLLTQKLCQRIAKLPTEIEAGEESYYVAEVVRSEIIENWQAKDNPEHLRHIRDRILYSERYATELLRLYQTILLEGGVPAMNTAQQNELRLSGLVQEQDGNLQVHNRIYRAVFTRKWVEESLDRWTKNVSITFRS